MSGRVARGITATIGATPLCELVRIDTGGARLLAKLESRNPCGSVKDRIAVAMIEDAERRGLLAPGGTIVEATSGNTGIALAFVAATKGYRLMVTMPERMSKERLALLRYLGARVTLTPGTLMREAIEKADELRRTTPGAIGLDQFRNPANAEILAYSPSAGSFYVNLEGCNARFAVEWMVPSSGAKTQAADVVGGSRSTFTPPFDGDSVLYLKAH